MCHFITAVLPTAEPPPLLRALVERSGLLFEPLHNPHVAGQLDAGEGYFRATDCMCDCGTGLGSAEATESRFESRLRAIRRKKKGWSEARLRRWVEQQETNRRSAERKAAARASTPTAEQWAGFLTEAIDLGEATYVGLLLHWYDGSPENEAIPALRRERISISPTLGQHLAEMSEDVLYVIGMPPAGARE